MGRDISLLGLSSFAARREPLIMRIGLLPDHAG